MQYVRGMQLGMPGSKHFRPGTIKVAATAKHFRCASSLALGCIRLSLGAATDRRDRLCHAATTVSRTIIAAIWVAFFSICQRYRC